MVAGRAYGDTRGDSKHGLNKGKKDHNTPSGYHDGRDNRKVIKRKDHRKNKGGRRRRIYESLDGRGEKIKERRSNNLYK
jgi:hypothetical protein